MTKTVDDVTKLLGEVKAEIKQYLDDFTTVLSYFNEQIDMSSLTDSDSVMGKYAEELQNFIQIKNDETSKKHEDVFAKIDYIEDKFKEVTENDSQIDNFDSESVLEEASFRLNNVISELKKNESYKSQCQEKINEYFNYFTKNKEATYKQLIEKTGEIDFSFNYDSCLAELEIICSLLPAGIKREVNNEVQNSDLTPEIVSLKELIPDDLKNENSDFEKLDKKIDEYIFNTNKIVTETDEKIGNFITEIVELKKETGLISKQFADLGQNQDTKISNIIDSITSDLNKINEAISELQSSVKCESGQQFVESSENIEKQINHLVELIETANASSSSDDSDTPLLKEIKDKITAIKQEVNLVNTDIIDTLNFKTDSILKELVPIKSAIENISFAPVPNVSEHSENNEIDCSLQNILLNIKQTITQQLSQKGYDNNLQEQINTSVSEIKKSINENTEDIKMMISSMSSIDVDNASNKISDLLDIINTKVDTLIDNSSGEIINEIDDLKLLISNQRDLLSNITNTDKFDLIQTNLEKLVQEIDTVDTSNLIDMRESIITAIVSVFDQISFIEESEDIKDFVEEKTDAIHKSITEVKQQIKKLTNTEDNDYTYTLQDVESDIAKLRIVLNDISASSTNEEISDISSNISKIVSSVEEMQNSLTQEQISQLKNNLEKLSEDVLSISSRTNKLLLSSDESYQSLTNSMCDFSNIISALEERVNYLDSKEITERVENKLDNALTIISASANSNKVMRQVLTYMGEWIDSASEKFSNLETQAGKIDEVQEIILNLRDKVPQHTELLNSLSEKFDEQQERMDRLEMKLEKILSAIEDIDDTKLTKKVDKVDKELSKLSVNVEKLTSYVDE